LNLNNCFNTFLTFSALFFCLLFCVFIGCKDNLGVETRTVAVGEDVTLTCPRSTSDHRARLYWIRFIPGHWPEFLGGTYSFNFNDVIQTAHITAKQETNTFTLHISKVQHSDTGLYYCLKADLLNMTFLKETFLRIRKKSNITAIVQHPLPDRVHPGNPVSLQCSVLFNSQDKTCSTDHRVFWFLAGSDRSHPSFIYAPANHGNECRNNSEDHSGRKCIYSFSKNITASDVGTYYCAVASCGEILFGNGTKLVAEDVKRCDSLMNCFHHFMRHIMSSDAAPFYCGETHFGNGTKLETEKGLSLEVILLLIAVTSLITSVIVNIAFLCDRSARAIHLFATQVEDENNGNYAALNFSESKERKTGRKAMEMNIEESVYSQIKF
uniref:Ig-like domain-containing protein n=1 Tax=Poecilia reticulata TaxID=8081 RepID=A0A3P9PHT9_POERE